MLYILFVLGSIDFFKQKTAYEMRISDWSSDVCSSDLIVIGVNALDYSGYPDCRPEFIAGFEKLAALATRDGDKGVDFHIHAPLQHMTKADIAAEAARLGMDAGMSWSCYDPTPEGLHCGDRKSTRLNSSH